MKRILPLLIIYLTSHLAANAQITTPVIRANFGVDADLRSSYFNGFVQSGNDDWFRLPGSDTLGKFVIDTTGAASILSRYASDPNFRKLPFYRTMNYPAYSIVNNRLLIDAVFIRDYHGDDSTMFASGSNKNGMSPQNWSCPVSQSIPDKNEILDMMVHVRRAGKLTTDSLWMFGGLCIENTTGNRYFDFEMYQTDIYYDRVSRQFYNYGPDAGHTSWEFDVFGNITKPGDIIFTAEYGSSSLTMIEARIWVNVASLALTPTAFNWSGLFDGAGAGATFGYASILPKTAGTFYTGLQSANGVWPGPFNLVLGNNSIVTSYIARQYMEFSVNLTKLGLDPVTLLGGNACGMPFRRVLVKTRASTSFTAELKDFVGPFDFFLAPRADVATDVPMLCDTGGVSHIWVTNPVATSTYSWSTTNGNIIGPTNGTSIYVDTPGTYIVTQYLQAGCSPYARDTIVIGRFATCDVLENNLVDFTAGLDNPYARLQWTVLDSRLVNYFDVERSTDGINFAPIGQVDITPSHYQTTHFNYSDEITALPGRYVYYRIRMNDIIGRDKYSNIIRVSLPEVIKTDVKVLPNPVRDVLQVKIAAVNNSNADIHIYDQSGKLVAFVKTFVQQGNNTISLYQLVDQPRGVYQAVVTIGNEVFSRKILLVR